MFEDLVLDIKPIGWVESSFEIGMKEKTQSYIAYF